MKVKNERECALLCIKQASEYTNYTVNFLVLSGLDEKLHWKEPEKPYENCKGGP